MQALLLLLSGALTAVPLANPSLSFLGYTAMIPLCIFLFTKGSEMRLRRALLVGICFGMGFFLVIYHWFLAMYPLEFLGFTKGEAVVAVLFCWIVLSLIQTAHLLLVPVLYRVLSPKKDWLKPLVLAALWVLFEWVQTLTWMGVPWSKLALGQYTDRAVLQVVSLFGSYFLTAILVLVNGYLALVLLRLSSRKHLLTYGTLALSILLLTHAISGVLLFTHQTEGDTVRVAALQANIGSTDKWTGSNISTLRRYAEMTAEAAAQGAELVVWPETVVTSSLTASKREIITTCATENNVTILFGGFQHAYDDDGEWQSYNCMFTAYPDGSIYETPYRKQHLVPFGEYLPMAEFIETFLPFLAGMNVLGSSLAAGDTTILQPTEWGNVGGMICYDSIYEREALSSVREGAGLLVLITNDSWYGDSAAVWQHNGDSVLRAVETGRYVVTSASTGISAVLSPTGEILDLKEPLTAGIVYGDISFESTRTLYSYVGNSFVLLCGLFCTTLLGQRIYAKIKKNKAKHLSA